MLGAGDEVSFPRVNHVLSGHAESFQAVPEFARLRRWTFAVALTHQNQRGGIRVLDEVDGGAAGVHLRVVVHGSAKVGHHPANNVVLAVVAEPVGEAGAGDGSVEAAGLGYRPHGHVAAVAPAGNAHAIVVHGEILGHAIHAGQDVVKVAIAEILNVGAGEGFALAVAAARVGVEHEVAHAGKQGGVEEGLGPARDVRPGRAAVDVHDEAVAAAGVVVGGIHQPALHLGAGVGPMNLLHLAPTGAQVLIGAGDLLPSADRPGPDFWRL